MEKGYLSINRAGDGLEYWMSIKLEDVSSGITFLEVRLSLENMMKALTNLGNIDCTFKLRGIENVGKGYEHKTELVKVKRTFGITDEEVDEVVQPYEVDGWSARKSDLKNHHNYLKDGYIKVHFSRFVERK